MWLPYTKIVSPVKNKTAFQIPILAHCAFHDPEMKKKMPICQ